MKPAKEAAPLNTSKTAQPEEIPQLIEKQIKKLQQKYETEEEKELLSPAEKISSSRVKQPPKALGKLSKRE